MASVDECQVAIGQLAARIGGDGRAAGFDRSISATIDDLDVTFRGRLHDGTLDDVTTEPGPQAQIRMQMSSDDLVAVAAGTLSISQGWLSGRIKVHASLPDLLRLRSMV